MLYLQANLRKTFISFLSVWSVVIAIVSKFIFSFFTGVRVIIFIKYRFDHTLTCLNAYHLKTIESQILQHDFFMIRLIYLSTSHALSLHILFSKANTLPQFCNFAYVLLSKQIRNRRELPLSDKGYLPPKLITNIIPNDEILNTFPLRERTRQGFIFS